jgi:hypothetical protein
VYVVQHRSIIVVTTGMTGALSAVRLIGDAGMPTASVMRENVGRDTRG